MEVNVTVTTKPYKPAASIYDAWKETLLPFLVPATVLSAWPTIMLIRDRNCVPIKLLTIAALVSLADGLLGSCAFSLQHQHAFSLSANSAFFYAGTVTYWLSGAALSPLMEVWGCRRSCMALALAGAAGAWGSGQSITLFVLCGRIATAAATSGLSTWVECALYHEAHGHHSPSPAAGDDKDMADGNGGEALGGSGALTIFHQVRPVMLFFSMIASQYVMAVTPTVSVAPCWVALLCYLGVFVVAWGLSVLPAASAAGSSWWTGSNPFHVNGGSNGVHGKSASMKEASSSCSEFESTVATLLPGVVLSCCSAGGSRLSAPQRLLRHYVHAYSASIRTLCMPRYLARHIVDIIFGAAFLTGSLLWVPTLELYDDSIPFGFVFELFMIATFLGSTFSLPVWAVGGAEAALVVLLSLSQRTLSTSRDYAIPVTIMLGGIVLHLTYGCVLTMGSLWRAEYAISSAPLTLLFLLKACTGVLGWVFLNAIDGKYMEDAFVFEAQWMWVLMWVQAVALTQCIVARMAPGCGRRANRVAIAKDGSAVLVQKPDSGNVKDLSSNGVKETAVAGGPTARLQTDILSHAPFNDVETAKL
ncbi:hypothetical protein LMJF_01_0440 [Leishmania major strain Friedlin]|uniref:Transmembrane protein n=1 Tax=Leishmania major TaxID=5664 RepID=E9AC35_LEIMA|nr:hypothetical protein LMJF_01_0440 [Leishmania major strain Friedlin]CAG9567109.1 Protein_of_unknown_function_(DUF791)_-_putative [Leishmania major strain Friedlin]CBZ11849.1 hypothetical protein LMJF_01_0440 [Leishmania major strain Friedlin]|eukprot:XP_003721566.1 hypothetical protein LMJF_01_0440 [Leishmania major strain Friedlin]